MNKAAINGMTQRSAVCNSRQECSSEPRLIRDEQPSGEKRSCALLINSNPWTSDCLSLGYIAAYAQERGYDAEVVDLGGGASPQLLAELIEEKSPELIGLSACQMTMENVLVLSRWFKAISRSTIILGGAQALAMPDRGLSELPDVDCLCRGEGELVVSELLRALSAGAGLEDAPGISYKGRDGEIRTNANPPISLDLDQYPSPYLTDVLTPRPGRLSPILTSRGCCFECTFCVTPSFSGRTVRCHSVDRVVGEIAHLHRLGQKDFWIADPLFLAYKDRVMKILRGIVELGADVSFWLESRASLTDRELLELMRKAGVRRVAFGLESANQKALDRMRKRQTIDQFTDSVRLARSFGFGVDLLHIVGAPDETLESSIANFDYIRRLGNYIDGYNSGNEYALYFGSEATRNPGAAGMVVEGPALKPDWPAYLSPGTHVRPASFWPGDKEEILRRMVNEVELAQLVRVFEALTENGLSAEEAAVLPLVALRDLKQVSFSGRMDLDVMGTGRLIAASEGPYDLVQLKRRSRTGTMPGRDELCGLFRQMTYCFQLNLIDYGSCLLFESALADALVELLTPPVLYRARIVFTIAASCFEERWEELAAVLERFTVRHKSPGLPEQRKPLARLTALFDLTRTEKLSPRTLARAAAFFERSNVKLFPFFRFERADGIGRYREVAAAALNGAGQTVVVASVEPPALEPLQQAYRAPAAGRPLPPLFVMERDTLLLNRPGWRPMDMGAHLIVWCEDWQRKRQNTRTVEATELRW